MTFIANIYIDDRDRFNWKQKKKEMIKMDDKRVIIVSKCNDCPFKEFAMNGVISLPFSYCSELKEKITEFGEKLKNCPLKKLDDLRGE